jgi:hypothetical protein
LYLLRPSRCRRNQRRRRYLTPPSLPQPCAQLTAHTTLQPTKTGITTGAESPTTARELDFDDDNEASAHALAHDNLASPPPISKSPKPGVRFSADATEIPPTKPPRPISAQQQAENTLIEAFPGIDAKVVKAVLVASGGKVEPAFNALLSTTPRIRDGGITK